MRAEKSYPSFSILHPSIFSQLEDLSLSRWMDGCGAECITRMLTRASLSLSLMEATVPFSIRHSFHPSVQTTHPHSPSFIRIRSESRLNPKRIASSLLFLPSARGIILPVLPPSSLSLSFDQIVPLSFPPSFLRRQHHLSIRGERRKEWDNFYSPSSLSLSFATHAE